MYKLDPTPLPKLLTESHQDIKWVWEPFIPEGSLCVCSAYMKVGKTTMVYALIKAIARGERFLNYPCKKTGILLLAVEEHRRDVANRFIKFGLDESDANVFINAAPLRPSQQLYDDLTNFIKINKIGLLVFDTLGEYWGIEDENDNAMVQKALSPLLGIARQTNCSILLVHHNSKGEGGEEGGAKGIRGASAIFGIVDQAIMLKKYGGKDSNQRLLQTFGRYDESPRELVIALTDDDQYILVGSVGDAKIEALRERLKGILGPSWMSVEDMVGFLGPGVTKRRVQKALSPCPDWAEMSGSGVRGDPHLYRLLNSNQTNEPEQPSGLAGYVVRE